MNSAVPEGWEETNLSTLVSVDSESLKGNTDPAYKFKYIDISCVSTGSVTPPSQHILFQSAPSRAKRVVRKNDVLIATVRPNLKAFAHFDEEGEDWVASTGFAVLRNKELADSRFIYNIMLSDDVSGQIDKLVAGSNYPAINSSDVKDLTVLSPPLPEQKKIASILTSVDEVIESTQKQIDKLQDLKKATMNELLTKGIGHTEFKDSELGRIPKSWEVVIGNDVLKLGGGASPSTITFCSDGDVLFMKVDDFNNPENYDEIASTYLSFLKESNNRIKIYPKGTVVIAKRGAAILKNRVKLFSRETTVDSNLMTIEVSRYHPKFFLYYLQWEDLSSLADTTSIPQLNNFHLYEHYFLMPPYKEQLKILETIFSIDKKTQTHRQKLAQTQSLKKSLMQDLLTGKVRVTVN